jgi:hypothetical protein
MAGIKKLILIEAEECGTEPSSLEHQNVEAPGQLLEQPWTLAVLLDGLDGSSWFYEVAEA